MAKPSDHPGFKALEAEWDQRLYDSGFRDIERSNKGDRKRIESGSALTKSGSALRYDWMDLIPRETQQRFYELVAQRFMETKFKKERERQILELYAQGISQAAIGRKLGIEGHRCKIYRPINKWLRAWGLK